MMKVPPVGMPRGMIILWSGQVYSSRGGQFLGGAEVGGYVLAFGVTVV